MARAMEGGLVVVADMEEVEEGVEVATAPQSIMTRQDTPPHHPQATLLHTPPPPPQEATRLLILPPLQEAILLPTPALATSRSEVCQQR